MSTLAEQAAKIRWFHSMDFGEFKVEGGRKLATVQSDADTIFTKAPVTGKTVLDIGSWDGFFAFEAHRRGAARVLATDYYMWITRDRKNGFDFAKRILNAPIEERVVDAMNISPETVGGRFDVVLLLGVLYHLQHPLLGLQKAAAVTRECLVVETHIDAIESERPAMTYYPRGELAGDNTNWWGPNRACVEAMLGTCGFPRVEYSPVPMNKTRGIFHAFR